MTKKQEYIIALKQAANGASFINMTQLSAFIGHKPEHVKKYVKGLQRLGGRSYFIPEVAELMAADTK